MDFEDLEEDIEDIKELRRRIRRGQRSLTRRLNGLEQKMSDLTDKVDAALAGLAEFVANDRAGLTAQLDAANSALTEANDELQKVVDQLEAPWCRPRLPYRTTSPPPVTAPTPTSRSRSRPSRSYLPKE